MMAYTYVRQGEFTLMDKPRPQLTAAGKIDTTPLITHRFPLEQIEDAYRLFENREDGVIKVAIENKPIR